MSDFFEMAKELSRDHAYEVILEEFSRLREAVQEFLHAYALSDPYMVDHLDDDMLRAIRQLRRLIAKQ